MAARASPEARRRWERDWRRREKQRRQRAAEQRLRNERRRAAAQGCTVKTLRKREERERARLIYRRARKRAESAPSGTRLIARARIEFLRGLAALPESEVRALMRLAEKARGKKPRSKRASR